MRFSLLPILAAIASLAAAQGGTGQPNSFVVPTGGFSGITAGKPVKLAWTNPTGKTVTIMLRQGSSGNLGSGTAIATHLTNEGSFTWTPSSSIVNGSGYALEIIDDDNQNLINYTPQFSISSPNTVSASASSASATSATSSHKSKASHSSSASSSSASAASTSSSASMSSMSSTGTTSSSTSTPTSNPAPVVEVGGSLLAVALGFAIAL